MGYRQTDRPSDHAVEYRVAFTRLKTSSEQPNLFDPPLGGGHGRGVVESSLDLGVDVSETLSEFRLQLKLHVLLQRGAQLLSNTLHLPRQLGVLETETRKRKNLTTLYIVGVSFQRGDIRSLCGA